MKKIFCLIIILFVSGCLETPKGKLPSINQAEIDMEAETKKKKNFNLKKQTKVKVKK